MGAANPLPQQPQPWIKPDGTPTQAFLQALDKLLNKGIIGPFPNFANDAAAAAGGVAINQLYRNGTALQVRVT